MKLKRGMRIDCDGYRGTIIEIGVIPHCARSCSCASTEALDVPGALIYWDHIVNDGGDATYPESLSRVESHDANNGRGDGFQWFELSRAKELTVRKRKR